ncbi:30S ribosomal protein S17 [Candidatus Roizmanbacteria bacterium CG02_land_8_20_14_3_00_36_15]|uniref:Small ribosomal subunit protein uS17 n=2 Tax=Candidatus Roizmaniibacteriota TaxID=1752723 RepID=A0A2M8KLS4_9BACT|nr:MAG: 30S ribosomal protein S17 [Candidatus Roizmanbacteria bacterium CG03_land_8_20_14_0_80_36_21]PIV37891.1 MAG: 30S ribosomal protein S17 [Candidatus Roizmanbacteria bacterium CG02_land_8_20_14_3_00_36_15]PIY69861.1 MAG: 30S ribosomal protein S17 [Candidatus Roizmanbacteria bacterium CG_4_10_14_0_8_um_filter_36_36]PJA53628.1 MAG: 30S ribosomal protein S17 [Candidatus Roizmanbacteria bacterium CG_4_9_14_3_um_filter_36_11]PJC81699.1 MAG: 30S ribosomal protein S17 [Candidatus Roizmanbacteria 
MTKIFIGRVVSNKMTKTVTVLVERKYRHPLYKKVIKRSKRYKVHNEKLDLKEGDMVRIIETRPISREKHFIVVNKVKSSK